MEATLDNFFNLYVLSTGRRVYALQQIKPIAADLEHKGLVAMINRAPDHESKTLELEAQWGASGYNSDPQRTALLTPILVQQEAVRQLMKSRRPLEDIDPTTGEAKPATQPSLPAGPVVDDN